MMYLLDTDWTVDFLGGRRVAVDLVTELLPIGVAISIITAMEILEGIKGSRDPDTADAALRAFREAVAVLDLTEAVADRTADIRLALRRRKRQVRERSLDLIVAATAIEHGLVLVTRNLRHFEDIEGLRLHRGPNG